MEERVCIIGAGPAGIVTGKVFLEKGFNITIYEKFNELGGTWSSQRRYVNLQTQADRGLLEFADLPHDTAFASAEYIQNYLREYATRFNITEDIQFETEVISITKETEGWTVTTQSTTDESAAPQQAEFDYVVVCSGLNYHLKRPDISGEGAFDGRVLHSCEIKEYDQLRDKRVVVIGFGKSALDISVEAATVGLSSTLVFRKPNWHLPKRLINGLIPYRYLLFSRIGQSLLPQYHNDDCVRLIDRLPEQIKQLVWKGITTDLIRSAGLHTVDDDLIPASELPHDIARTGVYPDEFVKLVRSGAITPIRGTVERFTSDHLRLSTDEKVPADVVVFGTGFKRELPVLNETLDIKTDDDQFYAYRSIVPPDADRIGIIGLRQSFMNFFSMEVSAHWLSAYFQEELSPMPSSEEMHQSIQQRLEWQKETIPRTQGFDFGPYCMHTIDELLQDLDITTCQTSNPIKEYFLPPRPYWYDELRVDRKAIASK